nr:alpha-isopropylmalate synthase regulatory domain-containing protein [bacterium]
MKKVCISDFTLRQSTKGGLSLSFREMASLAKCLDQLGVDSIDLIAVKNKKEDAIINRTIAAAAKNAIVCIPAGFSEDEVDAAWACVKDAQKPCLQVALPTSTVQMEYSHHMKADKMAQKAAELVACAKSRCSLVEFVAIDASRAERSFLVELCQKVAQSGATAVTLCDDAGIMTPKAFAQMVEQVKAAIDIPVWVCPSNALGMAAAAAVEAIEAGADGVKTTVSDCSTLGISQFADIMHTLGDSLKIESGLDLTGIHHAVSAFSHDAGTAPEAAGFAAEEQSALMLGGDSTIGDVAKACCGLGYDLSEEDTGKVYEEIKRVTAQKDSVGAKELEAIIASAAMQVPSTYHVDSYVCNTGNLITAMASVTLMKDGDKINGISTGDGPIDASFRAIEQAIGHHYELDDFQIQAVTEGREALGSALVRLRSNGRLYSGNGLSTDIVGASIRAFINALNKIVYEEN